MTNASTFLPHRADRISPFFLIAAVVAALPGATPVRAESFATAVEEAPEDVAPPDELPDELIVPRVEFMPELAFAQGRIQDPAIETVDEMDTRRSMIGGGRPGGGGGQWWD